MKQMKGYSHNGSQKTLTLTKLSVTTFYRSCEGRNAPISARSWRMSGEKWEWRRGARDSYSEIVHCTINSTNKQ